MKVMVKCLKCSTSQEVNGENNLKTFRIIHSHDDKIALMTGKNIVIEQPKKLWFTDKR
jgi:hypothetical protein